GGGPPHQPHPTHHSPDRGGGPGRGRRGMTDRPPRRVRRYNAEEPAAQAADICPTPHADQHGSGRGRRKRTRTTGTSPAAHFTRRGSLERSCVTAGTSPCDLPCGQDGRHGGRVRG